MQLKDAMVSLGLVGKQTDERCAIRVPDGFNVGEKLQGLALRFDTINKVGAIVKIKVRYARTREKEGQLKGNIERERWHKYSSGNDGDELKVNDLLWRLVIRETEITGNKSLFRSLPEVMECL